ncbi:enolase C-terminal domain-like protein [Micromonospora sp. NPDC048830]|uniref:enolase C-terminal domain-like protein n=1 Tax=Micromonospora sp. NPDC048830 TaxID=3364257 RepID=UPI003718CC16
MDPNIGLANQALGWVGIGPQPWLAGQHSALPTTIFIDVWQWTPMVVLILLAGLTSLSEEPQEAARIDGASAWQRFRHVTLPLLISTLIVAILLRGIDALKTFDILHATKGRDGGSFHEVETLNVDAYALSFDYNEYGVSSTVLIIFFLIIIEPSVDGRRYDYEPAQRTALPAEEDWDTRAYLRHLPGVFEAVRNEFGPELPLLHDGHHRMTPIQAARLGKALEPYDLFWLEDCTPAENQDALRLVRQHTTTPLAIGEVFNTVWDYQTLIREQLIDYVRSAVTHTGGITAMRKLLDYAAQYQIKSGIHGPTDISPVGMAAALHLDLAIHNFGIQEYMRHGPLTNEVFRQSFTFTDGYLHPGEQPGLGGELDEGAAARFPYQPAYLPFNRLKDGTVHDW